MESDALMNIHHFCLPSILSPFFLGDPNSLRGPLCFLGQVVDSRDKHVVQLANHCTPSLHSD